jgi:hypothetical protein
MVVGVSFWLMAVRSPIAIERPSVVLGLWIGPVLFALNYLVVGTLPLPHALLAMGISPLITVLALPLGAVAVFVYAAVTAAIQRRDAGHWVSLAIGTLAGTVALLAVVVGVMAAMAWIVA